MRYEEIRSVEGALLYFADCQLATVDELAMKKSRGKGDYDRQKRIAQKMCDKIRYLPWEGR